LSALKNLFWDSCIFIRYLSGDASQDHYADICRFIEDAQAKKRTIYYSTITLAEIRQEAFKGSPYGTTQEFFEDLGASFVPVEPMPNILIATGELRSAKSTNPGDPNPPKQRTIATPDAILLMTALFARDQLGISDLVFHTTDEGKGKNWYGKSVPIIGFETWYPEATRTDRIKQVCSLAREKPRHPEPTFEGIINLADVRETGRSA